MIAFSPSYFNPTNPENWEDESFRPGIMQFARALEVWVVMQKETPADYLRASEAFSCDPNMVMQAVEFSPCLWIDSTEIEFVEEGTASGVLDKPGSEFG